MSSAFDTEYSYQVAIPYEPGVTRRDPSPVIQVEGLFHAWYTRATADSSGYYGTVWHATSPDGRRWMECGEAVGTGDDDAWDGNGVFTPTVLIARQTYYLFYTAVPKPFDNDSGGPHGTGTAIGVAAAQSPEGPWHKLEGNPVLRPGPGAAVDGHRVDDACLVVRDNGHWMYYKGRQKGLTPSQTRMCLAIASDPTGPYEKSRLNPILSSGHEVCVWPHGAGVAALVSPCGPEGGTVQYSSDGLHFERMARSAPPSAPGPFRDDGFTEGSGPGITWGLCQDVSSEDRPFLLRFECDLRAGERPGSTV